MGAVQTILKPKVKTFPGLDQDADRIIIKYIEKKNTNDESFKEQIDRMKKTYTDEQPMSLADIRKGFNIQEEEYRIEHEKEKATMPLNTYIDKVNRRAFESTYASERYARFKDYEFFQSMGAEIDHFEMLETSHEKLKKELYSKMIEDLEALDCTPAKRWTDYITYSKWDACAGVMHEL
jgi:hypothetical protein